MAHEWNKRGYSESYAQTFDEPHDDAVNRVVDHLHRTGEASRIAGVQVEHKGKGSKVWTNSRRTI